jgi:hypothetical protein
MVREFGNIPFFIGQYRLVTFPVKRHWGDRADLDLIEASARWLCHALDHRAEQKVPPGFLAPLYLVRPGCGNGKLDWKDVKPILASILDDRFIVVERP